VTVIVLAACPVGLRGHLTRWLLEISPGVFVGKINSRVRNLMWTRITEMVKTGRAIMVYGADNEQGLAFKVHAHDWVPVDAQAAEWGTLHLRRCSGFQTQTWSSGHSLSACAAPGSGTPTRAVISTAIRVQIR
jgi:CRISPR-associated endoribonuclease Cas2 subtype I-E